MEPENENSVSFFRFEDLRVYHKSLDYASWVHQATQSFPANESGALTTTFLYASAAIALNIAEGSSRGRSQFILHLNQSKTAIRECVVYTSLARMLGYFDDAAEMESREHLQELTKMIGALIGSLQRGNGRKNDNKEADDDMVNS
jgi:four helix bundle protein